MSKNKKICKGCEKEFEQNQDGRIYISKKLGKNEKRTWFCGNECFLKFLKEKGITN